MLSVVALPSPPSPAVFEAGPSAPRSYGLFITLGIAAATWLRARELARTGYDGTLVVAPLFFVVPLGRLLQPGPLRRALEPPVGYLRWGQRAKGWADES